MGHRVQMGEEKFGQKYCLGTKHYEVDKEGFIYPTDEDAIGFQSAGFTLEETKSKAKIANASDLKDVKEDDLKGDPEVKEESPNEVEATTEGVSPAAESTEGGKSGKWNREKKD